MNEQKNCVIMFDKRLNRYVDRAGDIDHIEVDNNNRKFDITFRGGKTYTYNQSSVIWLTNPTSIDVQDKIVYSQNRRLSNVKQILRFGDDEWIKIVFENGTIHTYYKKNNEIKIIRNRVSDTDVKSCLSYLKYVSAVTDDAPDEKAGFLENELDKIEVSEESILSNFLADKPVKQWNLYGELIFPFSTNESQIRAVENALKYDISVIQGPPGTGKTQTILNIIANLLIRDKKIAVVSSNNEAVKNVMEKLINVGLYDICAPLGKRSNIKAFFQNVQDKPNIEVESENSNYMDFAKLTQAAVNIYRYRKQLALLNKKIAEYSIEKTHNDILYNHVIRNIPKSVIALSGPSSVYLEIAAFLETILQKNKIGIIDKLKLRLRYKLHNIKAVIKNIYDCIDYLQNRFYDVKLDELKNEREIISEFLAKHDNKMLLSDFEKLSMHKLKKHMYDYYKNKKETHFEIKSYKYHFNEFNIRYPIVFSTTHALHSCSGNYLYDYVIVDESSQVGLTSAVIAMSCARNIIFVGDLKQLPHIVKSQDTQVLKDIFSEFALPDYLNYSENSVLHSVIKKYGSTLPNVLLNEHYRCDPQIIEFCNKKFYNGQLRVHTKHDDTCGLVIEPSPPHMNDGRSNKSQVEIIKQILQSVPLSSIGIVVPYNAQKTLVTRNVNKENILVDTVHSFQGKERDVIILSTVSDKVMFYNDEEKVDFLNNDNLINVALSRAKNKLYVIASENLLNQDGTLINELARYAAYYCGADAIAQRKVYSIFELMYNEYSPILDRFKRKLLHVSDYQSENIVATVLKEICESGEFGSLDYKFNYPLRKIIDSECLSDIEDRQFVEHKNTHCDFIIYNKMDKSVRLVLEVDGRWHKQDIQSARDKRKDRLLEQANIKCVRLKTTDVNCENIIKNALTYV